MAIVPCATPAGASCPPFHPKLPRPFARKLRQFERAIPPALRGELGRALHGDIQRTPHGRFRGSIAGNPHGNPHGNLYGNPPGRSARNSRGNPPVRSARDVREPFRRTFSGLFLRSSPPCPTPSLSPSSRWFSPVFARADLAPIRAGFAPDSGRPLTGESPCRMIFGVFEINLFFFLIIL